MTRQMRTVLGVLYLGIGAGAAAGSASCRDPATSAPVARGRGPLAHDTLAGIEGEVLGNIYQSGVKTKNATYTIDLVPLDPATQARLVYSNGAEWVDTAGTWGFEWSDPRGGGNCGDLRHYLLGDTITGPGSGGRKPEVHRPAPNQTPTGVEKHCIRPGKYILTVAGRSYQVDYPAILHQSGVDNAQQIINATASDTDVIEQANYNDTLASFSDLVVNVDLTGGAYTDTKILDIENAHATPGQDTLTNQVSPSGSELDNFRFSSARSSSSWNLLNKGTMLVRLYWNYGRDFRNVTGYYSSEHTGYQLPIDRIHVFSELTQSQLDTVAAEIMRPDETPDSTRVVKRTVQITRSAPYACSTFEAETTWVGSDQYLSSACSDRSSGVQYRWQTVASGSWTSYSSDTIYDFLGYGGTGTFTATLDADSSGHSGFNLTNVLVMSGNISLSGPTYITSKQVQTYTSNHTGTWYERYDPALRWYPASAYPQSTLSVIWPAGDYTDQLRQDSSTYGMLRRGRLSITVCNPSSSCGPPPTAAISDGNGPTSSPTQTAWSVFGGGPWLSWGSSSHPQAVRLYDLWGMHDMSSAFTSASWVTDSGNSAQDPQGAWTIVWRPGPQAISTNARSFQFTITSNLVDPVSFGMAVDPDIGTNAADDISGFDNVRGMVYATDASGAVGFLLRDSVQDAVYAVQQFSRANPSPSTPAGTWTAQRQTGVHLVSGPRDVQLAVAAAPKSGAQRYWFVVIRGATLAGLQVTADSVITGLGGVPWQ